MREKKLLKRHTRQRIAFYMFLIPAMIGFSLLTLYPFVNSLIASFTNKSLLYPGDATWVDFKNYEYLLTKYPKFWPALENSMVYAFFNVILTNIIALFSAIILTQKVRGTTFFRAIFYIPSILPSVATTIMFASIFDASNGLVNAFLLNIGIPRENLPLWFASNDTALMTLIIMSCWGFGGKMIIFIAGLNNIPESYYEAARIDGSNAFHSFFKITLPLVTPALLYNLIGSIIGGMQVFTEAFVGAGGMDFYVGVIYNLAYTGTYRMGLASAMAWILCVIVGIIVFINMKLSKYYVNYEY